MCIGITDWWCPPSEIWQAPGGALEFAFLTSSLSGAGPAGLGTILVGSEGQDQFLVGDKLDGMVQMVATRYGSESNNWEVVLFLNQSHILVDL